MAIRDKLYLLFTTNLCKHDPTVRTSSDRILVDTTQEKLKGRILITCMDAIKYTQ